MMLASQQRLDKYCHRLLVHDESFWLARRGATTILASQFAAINVSLRTPHILPVNGGGDITASFGVRPCPSTLWPMWDDTAQAEPGVVLEPTSTYLRVRGKLALVLMPADEQDRRYLLQDTEYLDLVAHDLDDLGEGCTFDLLPTNVLRVRNKSDGEMLAMLMPMTNSAKHTLAMMPGCPCCGAMPEHHEEQEVAS